MPTAHFILKDYLARIGFEGVPTAHSATLTQLMQRQIFSVPFENIDVQAKRGISMNPEDIIHKIIARKRGGYCYEVNGLFAMALEVIGIEHQLLAARPLFYPSRRPRTHMVVLAKVDGEAWLCDTGFGSFGIRAPMRLSQLNTPIQQGFDTFQLLLKPDGYYVVQAQIDGEWVSQFEFNLSPFELLDFVPHNYFNSTHPDAVFVQKLLIIQHTESGRNILFGDQLKTYHEGTLHTQTIPAHAIGSTVQAVFGLEV